MYYVRYNNDHCFQIYFIVLWHLLVLMVAVLNLNTLDHILHKLVSQIIYTLMILSVLLFSKYK